MCESFLASIPFRVLLTLWEYISQELVETETNGNVNIVISDPCVSKTISMF